MKGLLYFVFLSITFIVKAQDTLYYKQLEDTIVCTQNEAKYYKVIDKTVSPFEVKTFSIDNRINTNEHFSSLTPMVKDGKYEEYFENGKIHIVGYYRNNLMDSIWMVYNSKTGLLEEKANFKDNLRQGVSNTYHPNGNLRKAEIYSKDVSVSSTCYDSVGHAIKCEQTIDTLVYGLAETMPTYPGGIPNLFVFLAKRINYPKAAAEKGLEGKVIVKFIIDTDGTVKDPVVIKDNVGGGCAEEALRVVRMMPKWIPGTQKGQPVKVYYTMPIIFKLLN